MYKEILIPVDNSDHSNYSIDMGVELSRAFGSTLVGNHVYAARLHDDRFRQMEPGLPEKYQSETELQKQRDIHDSLITRGLEIISDSYLDVFAARCDKAAVPYRKDMREGKNYAEIVKDVEENGYDLVIMGALGLGEVKRSIIGSVCERVVRRIRKDVIVMKHNTPLKGGRIVVGVDGSPNSNYAVKTAVALGKAFGASVEAVSAFDPNFHYTAFHSIAKVLSDEAGKVFRFKEQEKLHEEIIDQGLARIYQDHLDNAAKLASSEDFEMSTHLLSGKAFEEVLNYIEKDPPALLILGRVGFHAVDGLDIGSNTENILRQAPCNVMIVSGRLELESNRHAGESMPWTDDAEAMMERVPPMVRGIAKQVVEKYAKQKGLTEVTREILIEARGNMGMGGRPG